MPEKQIPGFDFGARSSDPRKADEELAVPIGDIPRLDKNTLSIHTLSESLTDKAYWLSRTPEERFAHVQYLRWVNYGDQAAGRLQRVLEIIERPWG